MALTDFNTAISNCASAIASGDFDSARSYLLQARTWHAGLAAEMRQGSYSLRYDKSISDLEDAINREESRTTRKTDRGRFVRVRTGYPR